MSVNAPPETVNSCMLIKCYLYSPIPLVIEQVEPIEYTVYTIEDQDSAGTQD